MSQFNQILEAKSIAQHDARPLWRYNLSDKEFAQLADCIRSTRGLGTLDPRDCTLYYAEWWRRCYTGGYPSKAEVFSSVHAGQHYDAQEFYEYAKSGAILLGIRWIKGLNTLYFKTLLLQGGLPIKHIAQNKGAYSRFLEEIIKLRPTSTDDFSFDTMLTTLLPQSARNDNVYESCLYIVRAVLDNDAAMLQMLQHEGELTEMVGRLQVIKAQEPRRNIGRKVRAAWMLEPEKGRIGLVLKIGELTSDELSEQLRLPRDYIVDDAEYRLFYNDALICKLIRRGNGVYLPQWMNGDALNWEPDQQLPNLYFLDTAGQKLECPHLIAYQPRPDIPTLWIQYSEKEFLLERGRNTAEMQGFVLGPQQCNLAELANTNLIQVHGTSLYWTEFDGELEVAQSGRKYCFKTRTQKFDWYIPDARPGWMHSANMRVTVNRCPAVVAYDKKGAPIPGASIKWRRTSETTWQPHTQYPPVGHLELKIEVGGVAEYDECYNIGILSIEPLAQELTTASLRISGNPFELDIQEPDIAEVSEGNNDQLHLKLKNAGVKPVRLNARLKLPLQKSLRFAIWSPFNGTAIVDNEQLVLGEHAVLQASQLKGYRLITTHTGARIRLRNTSMSGIVTYVSLNRAVSSLQDFEKEIEQLFSLTNPLKDCSIEMTLCKDDEGRGNPIPLCTIVRYKGSFTLSEPDGGYILINPALEADALYAMPLEGGSSHFAIIALPCTEEGFALQSAGGIKKYMVFATGRLGAVLKPALAKFPDAPATLDSAQTTASTNGETYTAPTSPKKPAIVEKMEAEPYDGPAWRFFLACYIACINHRLPFNSFNSLKALVWSPQLVAKAFALLVLQDKSYGFGPEVRQRLERELCLSFHWVSGADWLCAMEWAGCSAHESVAELISSEIFSHYTQLPASCRPLAHYITGQPLRHDHAFAVQIAINEMRASLGEAVLSALPAECPAIEEAFKSLIPARGTGKLRLMLTAPVAIALSIAGRNEQLWSPAAKHARRNIQYCQQLAPDWYGKALVHTLAQILKQS